MSKETQKKVAELAREIEREIKMLEQELAHKKEFLKALTKLEFTKPAAGRRFGRPAAKIAQPEPAPMGTRKGQKRRKSKNRDIILNAASALGKRFSLAELAAKIHEKNPGFGGEYVSGTILSVLKTTPEIKKIRRGTYSYKG